MSNIGSITFQQGNYSMAIEYYQAAIKNMKQNLHGWEDYEQEVAGSKAQQSVAHEIA